MNKKLDLSSLKLNDSVVVAVAMVILIAILGVIMYFTVNMTVSAKLSINRSVETANANVEHIKELEKIKSNQTLYREQLKKYDELIAERGSYSRLAKQAELEDMLEKYSLTGDVSAGTMESYASVQMAESTVNVVGKESDIKAMCNEILSSKYVVRIDSFAIADNGDGTATAAFTVVNFTK